MAHCFGRVVGGLLQGGGEEVGGSEAGAKAGGNVGTWQERRWEVEGGDPGVLYLFPCSRGSGSHYCLMGTLS